MRVGIEGTGYSRWFERLLAELSFGLWIGGPAEIKAERVKEAEVQNTNARRPRKFERFKAASAIDLVARSQGVRTKVTTVERVQ